jgi:hypothetical protein
MRFRIAERSVAKALDAEKPLPCIAPPRRATPCIAKPQDEFV